MLLGGEDSVFVCTQGLFTGQISSWYEEKFRGFPLDFGGIRLLPENLRHLRKTAAVFSRRIPPKFFDFILINAISPLLSPFKANL